MQNDYKMHCIILYVQLLTYHVSEICQGPFTLYCDRVQRDIHIKRHFWFLVNGVKHLSQHAKYQFLSPSFIKNTIILSFVNIIFCQYMYHLPLVLCMVLVVGSIQPVICLGTTEGEQKKTCQPQPHVFSKSSQTQTQNNGNNVRPTFHF